MVYGLCGQTQPSNLRFTPRLRVSPSPRRFARGFVPIRVIRVFCGFKQGGAWGMSAKHSIPIPIPIPTPKSCIAQIVPYVGPTEKVRIEEDLRKQAEVV